MVWRKKQKPEIRQREICRYCGVDEGQYHVLGCDKEDCPFCGWQLISCDCRYELLNLIDKEKYDESTSYLPPEIYKKGLTKEQGRLWEELLNQKGRIPFILYPHLCAKCGRQWPGFFMAPDEEWNRYIQPDKRGKIICRECYDFIKEAIDSAKEKHNAAKGFESS
jgi:hypothetical protein